jgi:hypothetical protein
MYTDHDEINTIMVSNDDTNLQNRNFKSNESQHMTTIVTMTDTATATTTDGICNDTGSCNDNGDDDIDDSLNNIIRGMDAFHFDDDDDADDADDTDDEYDCLDAYENMNDCPIYNYQHNNHDIYSSLIEEYEDNYTYTQLRTICEYYKIHNVLQHQKSMFILSAAIVQFEKVPKHKLVVNQRKTYWNNIMGLYADTYMKKFMAWK